MNKYQMYGKKHYQKNREKIIANTIKWQKNNKEKCKIIAKRYYDTHTKAILLYAKEWYRLNGKDYYNNNRERFAHYAHKYYSKNTNKWDRYRYKHILKHLDIHEKNLRIAKLFIKRVNKLSGYQVKPNNISMKSNGRADIKIKLPNLKSLTLLKEKSQCWADNFNTYTGSKVNLKVKTIRQPLSSNYSAIVSVNEKALLNKK